MRTDVEVGVLTKEELLAPSTGAEVLKVLRRHGGVLVGHYGNFEPMKAPFEGSSEKRRLAANIEKATNGVIKRSEVTVILD